MIQDTLNDAGWRARAFPATKMTYVRLTAGRDGRNLHNKFELKMPS